MNDQNILEIREYISGLPLADEIKNDLLRVLEEQGPSADLMNRITDAITSRHDQDVKSYIAESGLLNSMLDETEHDLRQAEEQFEVEHGEAERSANDLFKQANKDIDEVELEIAREELQ
jgi:hypothetical protein